MLVVYEASVVGIWTHPHDRWRLLPAVTGWCSVILYVKIPRSATWLLLHLEGHV